MYTPINLVLMMVNTLAYSSIRVLFAIIKTGFRRILWINGE